MRRISTPHRIDSTTMRTVAVYGNSLVVSSIGASLQGRAGLEVKYVDATLPNAASRLAALQPDVVIFDLAVTQPEFALALWKARPRLVLIGVDLTNGHAFVLSSQSSRLLTMDDLLQVIEG